MKSTCRFGLLFSLTFTALAAPLSAQTPADPTSPLVSPLKSAERSVVCGLTILSPSVVMDTAMARPVPPGNFSMRVAQPKVCSENKPLAFNAPGFPAAGKPGGFLNRLPTFLGPKR
jgi:hypothetical protein